MTQTIAGIKFEDGLDVSNWQGHNSWEQVPAEYKFVWAKATEGGNYTDAFYNSNVGGAQATGRVAGAYDFMHPNKDGAMQARYLLGRLRGDELLAPVCDAESHAQASRAGNTREILRWFEVVEAAINHQAVFYSYVPWMVANLDPDPALRRLLWVAAYGSNDGAPHTRPSTPAPWSYWEAWQYTSTRNVPGIGSRIDANLAEPKHLYALLLHPPEFGVSPDGYVDRVVGHPGEIEVAGWAVDPDRLEEHVGIHVYVNGDHAASFTATDSRPDVAEVFPEYGARRGFGGSFAHDPALAVHVEVYALDLTGEPNTKIGDHYVGVPSAGPGPFPGTTDALPEDQIEWLRKVGAL